MRQVKVKCKYCGKITGQLLYEYADCYICEFSVRCIHCNRLAIYYMKEIVRDPKKDAGEHNRIYFMVEYILLLEKELDKLGINLGGIRHLMEIKKPSSYGIIEEMKRIYFEYLRR